MENIFKLLALSSLQGGGSKPWRPLSVPVGCITIPPPHINNDSQRCENHKASIRNGNMEVVVWVGDFTHYELHEIWQAVRTSSTITVLTLHISGANERDYHLDEFFSAVRASPQLMQLYLYYYHTLIDKSLPYLEKCLENNSTLQRLCVRYSRTTITSSVALVNSVLRPSQTLTKLDLMHCMLGPCGAKQMALFLPTNRTLKELLLKGSNIGTSGATDIALALHRNQTLHILDLSQNEIMCAGALAVMLKENQHLQVLELRANQISCAGASALYDSVRFYNVTLIRLDLSRNAPLTFDPSTVDLLQALERLTLTHQTISRLILTLQHRSNTLLRRLPRELFQVLATFL